MKIVLLTLGTRGDVQPFVALGLGLKHAGYTVTVGTSRDFKGFVTDAGLEFAPFRVSVKEMLADSAGRAAFESKRAALQLYRKSKPMMRPLLDDAWNAAQGARAVLYHSKILNGLGVGRRPLAQKTLTAEALAEATKTVLTNQSMQPAATALGQRS